jgi:hypothetical protein
VRDTTLSTFIRLTTLFNKLSECLETLLLEDF